MGRGTNAAAVVVWRRRLVRQRQSGLSVAEFCRREVIAPALIWYKRLECGTFALPAVEGDSLTLSSAQLSLLLGGIDLCQTRPRKRFRRSA